MRVQERIYQFGAGRRLVGTIALPVSHDEIRPDARIGIVTFNAGFISRHGPHRLNVKINRHLGARGLPSLRFDLSGLGDSDPRPGAMDLPQRTLEDLTEAVDLLTSTAKISRVVLCGLCSGTDACLNLAATDRRVAGIYLLDPWAFPTRRTKLNNLVRSVRRQGASGRLLLRFGRMLKGKSITRSGFRPDGRLLAGNLDVRERPSAKSFSRTLRLAVQSGVHVQILYTGSSIDVYNYDRQFAERFRPLGVPDSVHVDYEPKFSHMFTESWMQEQLLHRLAGWSDVVRNHVQGAA